MIASRTNTDRGGLSGGGGGGGGGSIGDDGDDGGGVGSGGGGGVGPGTGGGELAVCNNVAHGGPNPNRTGTTTGA